MSNVRILKNDITKLNTDAIVNAANSELLEGGGVCGAIFRAAGSSELARACRKLEHCDTGSAVITPGFKLKAKYVIHAVGPVWRGGRNGELSDLYSAYKNSLRLARKNDCHSIAFPLISSGIYGHPLEDAWKQAIHACVNSIITYPDYEMDIFIAVLDDSVREMGEKMLKEYAEREFVKLEE